MTDINDVTLQGKIVHKFVTPKIAILTINTGNATSEVNYPKVLCFNDLRDIAETKFNEGDFVLVHGNIQSSRRRPEIKNQSTIAIFGESLEPAQSSIEQETGIKAKDARIPFINKFVVAGEVKGVDSPTSDMVRLRIATNKNGHLSFVRLVHFTHNPADIINEIKAGDRVCVVGCTQTNKKLVDDETRYFEDYVALEIAKDRN